jgi:hypothetical protein
MRAGARGSAGPNPRAGDAETGGSAAPNPRVGDAATRSAAAPIPRAGDAATRSAGAPNPRAGGAETRSAGAPNPRARDARVRAGTGRRTAAGVVATLLAGCASAALFAAVPPAGQPADPGRPGAPVIAAPSGGLPWPSSELPHVEVRAADHGGERSARELAGVAPRIVEQVALRLALPAPREVLVLVAARAPRDSAEAAALGVPGTPYWAAGLADPRRARILLFADRLDVAGHEGLPGALAHEAAHLVLGTNVPETAEVPRWYDEGLAMLVERDLSWRDAFEIARMVVAGDPPPLSTLAREWPATGAGARAAYAAALSFVGYVQRDAAPGAPRRLVEALRQGADFERAFVIAYGSGTAGSEAAWRGTLGDRYIVLPLVLLGTVANVALGIFALLALAAGHVRRRRRMDALGDDAAPARGEAAGPWDSVSEEVPGPWGGAPEEDDPPGPWGGAPEDGDPAGSDDGPGGPPDPHDRLSS